MGRVTSDVIRGMSVTQFIGVGHLARSDFFSLDGLNRVTLLLFVGV